MGHTIRGTGFGGYVNVVQKHGQTVAPQPVFGPKSNETQKTTPEDQSVELDGLIVRCTVSEAKVIQGTKVLQWFQSRWHK